MAAGTIMAFTLPETVLDALERVSGELAKKRRSDKNRRSRDRSPLQVPCQAFIVGQRTDQVVALTGQTLDISRSGIGLLLRKLVLQDDPIEVHIVVPNRAPLYLAGLVRFCMYITDGFFKVGIQLMESSPGPIFTKDPAKAIRQMGWLSAAICKRSERAFFIEGMSKSAAVPLSPERLVR